MHIGELHEIFSTEIPLTENYTMVSIKYAFICKIKILGKKKKTHGTFELRKMASPFSIVKFGHLVSVVKILVCYGYALKF